MRILPSSAVVDALSSRDSAIHRPGGVSARFQRAPISKKAQLGHLEGAKIHDERDRNRGLRGAVRTPGVRPTLRGPPQAY
jgi:hypothetical protein